MTEQQRRDLAARLVVHADTWERVGNNHTAFRDSRLVKDLRDAATELRTVTVANLRLADETINGARHEQEHTNHPDATIARRALGMPVTPRDHLEQVTTSHRVEIQPSTWRWSRDEWFSLPLPLRQRWWAETERSTTEPFSELLKDVEAVLGSAEQGVGKNVE